MQCTEHERRTYFKVRPFMASGAGSAGCHDDVAFAVMATMKVSC